MRLWIIDSRKPGAQNDEREWELGDNAFQRRRRKLTGGTEELHAGEVVRGNAAGVGVCLGREVGNHLAVVERDRVRERGDASEELDDQDAAEGT